MFLYWVPGNRSNVTSALSSFGYALDGGKVSLTCELMSGPDGQRGTLLANRTVPSQYLKYDRTLQAWRDCGAFWLGMWNDERKPTPDALRRNEVVAGYSIELADGNQWEVPRGLCFEEETQQRRCALPRAIDVDAQGQWVMGDVKPRYGELWDATKRFYDAWMAEIAKASERAAGNDAGINEIVVSLTDELDMVELCLQTNYRISRWEMAALGLIDRDIATQVLLSLIDWPTWEAYVKKKTQRG